jgi:hypothetical protein
MVVNFFFFKKLISKKYKKIMNAISNPDYNVENDVVDFVEFSNLKFQNNKLIIKYQEKTQKSTLNLITSLLSLEDNDRDEINNFKSNNNNNTADEINKYTTYIELEKIKFDKKNLDLFIHFNVLNKLEKNNVINWHSNTALFYPIKTLGDGNCLVSLKEKHFST